SEVELGPPTNPLLVERRRERLLVGLDQVSGDGRVNLSRSERASLDVRGEVLTGDADGERLVRPADQAREHLPGARGGLDVLHVVPGREHYRGVLHERAEVFREGPTRLGRCPVRRRTDL